MITSTNRSSLGYIEEVTAGVTPATPAFQLLPFTKTNISGNTETKVSEAIRSDRMIDDLIVTNEDINGDIDFEVSFDAYSPLLKSLLRGTPVTIAVSGNATISIADADKSINSASLNFVTTGIVAGMFLKVSGFTDPANNDVFKVATVATGKVTFDTTKTLVDEAIGDPINLDVVFVPNGESVEDSYSFVKRIQGIASPAYFYHRGCQISKTVLNFEIGSILTGTMSVVGLSEEVTSTEFAGSTYTDVAAYSLMNSVSSVSRVKLIGVSGANYFSNLTLTIDNMIKPAKAIGTLGAIDLAAFTLEITGEITLYFEDKTMYDYYKNSTSFIIDLLLQDEDGNYIGIELPNCKFEKLETPVEGKDNFFMATGTFRSLRDATKNRMIGVSFIAN